MTNFFKTILNLLIKAINNSMVEANKNISSIQTDTAVNTVMAVVESPQINLKEDKMGYSFGKSSKAKLDTCHKDIQAICNELIKLYDFSVIYGIRTQEEQVQLFKEGKSKLDGIKQKSKHQGAMVDGKMVSMAVDLMPYKKGENAFSGNEKDDRRFYTMMGMVKAIAFRLKEEGKITHDVRFGLDWDGDDTYRDQTFDDLPHFELV